MRFTLPQFIEREAKIIGPLTFKQFLYFGFAGFICFIVYFSFSLDIFILSVLFFGGIASAFSFLNINGTPITAYLWNFFRYSLSPKTYLWQKKGSPGIEIQQGIGTEEEGSLKVNGNSKLNSIKTSIETEIK